MLIFFVEEYIPCRALLLGKTLGKTNAPCTTQIFRCKIEIHEQYMRHSYRFFRLGIIEVASVAGNVVKK